MTSHRARIAVVTADLPPFAPPFDRQGLECPYSERLSVELDVSPLETLGDVYERAIDRMDPQLAETAPMGLPPLSQIVRWAWFYEPRDAGGISAANKVWEVSQDLITVDQDGLARWNRSAAEIPFEDLVRAGEQGLLRGDPHRPYLVLILPQGGETLQGAWEGIQIVWEAVGHLLIARELIGLAANRFHPQTMAERIRQGGLIIERLKSALASRGAGPREVLSTLERKPWPVDDLRILLGLESQAEAIGILEVFGLRPRSDGMYELSDDEEARILNVLAHEAARGRLDPGFGDRPPQDRLRALLATGELPEP